ADREDTHRLALAVSAPVGIWVPRGGVARRDVQGGDAVPRLSADGGEAPAHVHRGSAHSEGSDVPTAGVRIPRGRVPGRSIQRGDTVARLPADAGEGPGGVD